MFRVLRPGDRARCTRSRSHDPAWERVPGPVVARLPVSGHRGVAAPDFGGSPGRPLLSSPDALEGPDAGCVNTVSRSLRRDGSLTQQCAPRRHGAAAGRTSLALEPRNATSVPAPEPRVRARRGHRRTARLERCRVTRTPAGSPIRRASATGVEPYRHPSEHGVTDGCGASRGGRDHARSHQVRRTSPDVGKPGDARCPERRQASRLDAGLLQPPTPATPRGLVPVPRGGSSSSFPPG
jgi:hypothetical protein